MNDPVCFVDCETTGLDPERHEIWEVGLITPDGEEHVWQLPVYLSRADPIALSIGRFHDRRAPSFGVAPKTVRDGIDIKTPDLQQFAREFVALTRDQHLAGACVSFDADRLWRLLRGSGECPMWHYHLIDVEVLAAGWLAAQDVHVEEQMVGPPWKSTDLSRAVSVNPDYFDRHTALGDARWAKAIYEAVMDREVANAQITCSAVWTYKRHPPMYCQLKKDHIGDHRVADQDGAPRWPNLADEPF